MRHDLTVLALQINVLLALYEKVLRRSKALLRGVEVVAQPRPRGWPVARSRRLAPDGWFEGWLDLRLTDTSKLWYDHSQEKCILVHHLFLLANKLREFVSMIPVLLGYLRGVHFRVKAVLIHLSLHIQIDPLLLLNLLLLLQEHTLDALTNIINNASHCIWLGSAVLKTQIIALITPQIAFRLTLPVESSLVRGHSTNILLWFLDLIDFHLLGALSETLDTFTQTLVRCFVHHWKSLVHLMTRGYNHWLARSNS